MCICMFSYGHNYDWNKLMDGWIGEQKENNIIIVCLTLSPLQMSMAAVLRIWFQLRSNISIALFVPAMTSGQRNVSVGRHIVDLASNIPIPWRHLVNEADISNFTTNNPSPTLVSPRRRGMGPPHEAMCLGFSMISRSSRTSIRPSTFAQRRRVTDRQTNTRSSDGYQWLCRVRSLLHARSRCDSGSGTSLVHFSTTTTTNWSKRGNINTAALDTIVQCNTLVARCSRQLMGPADWVLVTLGPLHCD